MTRGAPSPTLNPGDTVGILGGGQLGRMLSLAAASLGLRTHIFCPDADCPAFHVSDKATIAAYTEKVALEKFAAAVDIVTYEFENVPVEAVGVLENAGATVRPGAAALEKAQDRLVEKKFIRGLGIATAEFHGVDDLAGLEQGLKNVGRPAILKTRRLGYDGKGQTRLTDKDIDLHASFEKAVAFAWAEVGAAPSILEAFVPFEREISIIGARAATGAIQLYEPLENVHVGGILKTSTAPAQVTPATRRSAEQATIAILEALDYVGVIGVEFFVLPGGDIVVNEMAPRVHNSGHLTADACAVSQFEQHIRAVAGWPLGDPVCHSGAVMENLIGNDINAWNEIIREPNAAVHLYGKGEARPGRKMGHVTRITPH